MTTFMKTYKPLSIGVGTPMHLMTPLVNECVRGHVSHG